MELFAKLRCLWEGEVSTNVQEVESTEVVSVAWGVVCGEGKGGAWAETMSFGACATGVEIGDSRSDAGGAGE